MKVGYFILLLGILPIFSAFYLAPGSTPPTSGNVEGKVEEVEGEKRLAILNAMKEEMERNHRNLKFEDHPPPYFISYSLYDTVEKRISARYGAKYEESNNRSRVFYVDVRVGDYSFDSSPDKDSFFDFSAISNPYGFTMAPLEDDLQLLKYRLWLITDEEYKNAVTRYLKKKGKKITTLEEKVVPSFSVEDSVKYIEPDKEFRFDTEKYGRLAKEASRIFRYYPFIFDGVVSIRGEKITRYFVSTEGTELLTSTVLFTFSIYAVTRADDGMLLEDEMVIYSKSPSGLPSSERMKEMVRELSENLVKSRHYEVLDPYTGPAILGAEVAGVLFHEALGHRLEGERQDDDKEGQTFRGQIGKKIIPDFVSLIDDPTLEEFNKIPLNGHYLFDDEGVKAKRVQLVEKGILKNFLMSRTPITDSYGSNGHGRSAPGIKPVSRMGNLIVHIDKSVPDGRLKKKLIKECKRRGKKFGLRIEDVAGGSTDTSALSYQAFKGIPRRVYKVDVNTGRETPVRGIELIGTPLLTLNKILFANDRYEVFNGFCGAESGLIPVSVIGPSLLIEGVEVQRMGLEKVRLPILQPPELPHR